MKYLNFIFNLFFLIRFSLFGNQGKHPNGTFSSTAEVYSRRGRWDLGKFIKYILLPIFLFNTALYAVDHGCEGTLATPVHTATGNANYIDTENSTGGRAYSGYYRFRTQIDGSIRIRVDQMNSNQQRIYIGTSCGDSTHHYVQTNSGMDETFDVTANQWFYIRIRERNPNNRIQYRIQMDFTASTGGSIDVFVVNDNDDAEEQPDESVYLDSSDLEMVDDGDDQTIGIRFLLTIPENAEITNAYIEFQADGDESDSTSLAIYAQNSDTTARFSDSSKNITDRPKTTSVDWDTILPWTDDELYRTPNLKDIVQTVINRASWDRSSLTFIIDGSGLRRAESYDGGNTPPKLHIEYTINTTPRPPVVNPIPTPQTADGGQPYTLDLSTFVTLTNGDPIIPGGYVLTGSLPAELTFDTNTGIISGTPLDTTANYPLSLTAEDKDGVSNSESFILSITEHVWACFNNDSGNDFCPGAVVVEMDQADTSRQRCIYGESSNGDAPDYYRFTVQAFGSLDITGSRTDGNTGSYYLKAGSSCEGTEYGDEYTNNPVIPTIDLIPGDTVYIYVKESGSDTDHYQIDFKFIVDDTFHANDDTYNTALDQPKTMDVLTNDNPGSNPPLNHLTISTGPTNGSAIVTGDNIIYTPNPGYTGTDTLTYTVNDDNDMTSNEATVTITVGTLIHRGSREFLLRNPAETRNIKGNIKVIGNTVQCVTNRSSSYGVCSNNRNHHNNSYYTDYIDIDNNSGTFNSSSSTLALPTGSKVIWAGLYWQGYLHNSTSGNDVGFNTYISGQPHLGGSTNQLIIDEGNSWGTEAILMKRPTDTTYQHIAAEIVDFDYLGYASFLNITSMLDVDNPNGTYMFANIIGNRGRESNHGNYGGWTIVFIYTDPNGDSRNVSVFDGYWTVNSSSPINITVSGFRTPTEGNVNSSLSLFSMEGEYGSGGDYFEVNGERVIDQENSDTDIFDGSISTGSPRNPTYANNDGLDLDVFDVSDKVGNGDTSATLKSATGGDRYTPSMFAFSTELYVPDICYDFTIDMGTGRPNNSLHIDGFLSQDNNLTTKVLIKSMEGDLNLENSTLIVKDLNALKWHFSNAKYSPNDTFAYLPATIIDHRSSYSEIAFGNDDGDMSDGGTISPNQLMYAKFFHEYLTSGDIEENINIDLVTHMDFGSGPVEYHYSTDNAHLPLEKCPTNVVYNPVPGIFNIERLDTNATDPDNIKYPLYTQISGKDFDVSVVSYNKDDLTQTLDINNTGVQLELINAGSFDNNASTGFDAICQDYDLSKINTSQFVPYPVNTPTSRVDLRNANDLNIQVALQNAAFRVWYIADQDNTLAIKANCYQPNLTLQQRDLCFSTRYIEIKGSGDTLDPSNYCIDTCGSGTTGCYECLKLNFGHPVCSRDNFAIRPETYRIHIQDDLEGNTTVVPLLIAENDTLNEKSYAAEYQYKFDVNATLYGVDTNTREYYKSFPGEENLTSIPTNSNGISFGFKTSTGSSCADTTSKKLGYIFNDGQIINDQIMHNNVGDYNLSIVDTNWTIVDQINSRYKPYPNVPDCATGLTGVDVSFSGRTLSGCLIKSDYDTSHTVVNLSIEPYQFELSSIALYTRPNDNGSHLYMNNLRNDQNMSVKLEGNITAIGKAGTNLSNFTNNCAAKDVFLWLNRTMQPILENNINDSSGSRVLFQQALKDTNGMVLQDTSSNYDMNASLVAVNFTSTSDLNGSAVVDLYYNFQKPYDQTVNPVDVNFSMLSGISPTAVSNAHMIPNYIPDGNVSINQTRWFYFAKVAPAEGTDGRQEYGPSVSTTIRVMTYCDSTIAPCPSLPGLAFIEESDHPGWYKMTNHLSSNGEGQINNINIKNSISGVTISPNNNITFDTNGTTGVISITYPVTNTRPVHPIFEITPDEWLKYDSLSANLGLPNFVIHFLTSGLRWKGKGETGHVMETEPTPSSSGRLNW